jgi:hypothetical protein
VKLHALDLVLGHVPIIAKIHVLVIAKAVAQLGVLHATVVLAAVVAMVPVQSDVTLPAVRQPTLNFQHL